ncbi:hypothetical protein [Sphingobacterium hungaricum]|uniref:Uncharacterized protein n=1 Tax=Sphingobacterium hungaricum TaxID=2082723 RepID=A0A928YPJ0_9SPHI|nr:hypothetical protein [Sphingobacterium hungaricum]MBE8712557.1 hypothetical protein [Sphingobacterium hungaricum]
MENITKETTIFCQNFDFFGTIQELKELIEDIGEWQDNQVVNVEITSLQPFMNVDDDWLIELISREVERQGCDNERSSDSGDEMQEVEKLLIKHVYIDYDAVMKEMPQLFYSKGKELQIDLNNF